METIVVESTHKVQYTVIRSRRRRRLALKVTDAGAVEVRASHTVSRKDIDMFVGAHRKWIEKHLDAVMQLPLPVGTHFWTDGDRFLFLGSVLTLRIVSTIGRKTICTRTEDTLEVHCPALAGPAAVRRAIIAWYRKEGLALYEELVSHWAATIGVPEVTGTDITQFPRRWGSCTRKGKLSFALRSLMLPKPLVEYLALHEVAHLVHFNHGTQFRALLDTHMSDWKDRQYHMNRLRLQAENL